MTHMKAKLAIAGIILVTAVAYLGFAGIRSGWVYYVQVDDFLADTSYHDQRVRLCGIVTEDSYSSRPADLAADFRITGVSHQVPVVYRGVVPATFKVGAEVVVEGRLDEAGVFQANVMLTKCASKYEADDHAKRVHAEES